MAVGAINMNLDDIEKEARTTLLIVFVVVVIMALMIN
jgi:hypothetical protein